MSRRGRRNIVVGLVGVLTIVSFFLVRTLYQSNYFATLSPSFDGTCTSLPSPPGPEDIELDRRSGIAYVSSTDRRAAIVSGFESGEGDIFVLDMSAPEEGFMALNASAGSSLEHFLPHGISLYRDEVGRTTLMAVNHPTLGENTIEIFDLFEEEVEGAVVRQLVHRRTVSGDLIISPNDVLAIGHDQFYATNDHGSRSGLGSLLEDYLRLDRSSVIYFDGESTTVAAKGLTYANGIAMSEDGSQVVVAETTDSTVRFYTRDLESGDLSLVDKVEVHTGVDNVDRAADGSYWIGSHAQLLKFVGHAADKTVLSPSHVIRVVPTENGAGGKVEQIYLNLGDEISGASVAVEHNGQMLIGQVFDPHVLLCNLPN